jgi:hypothetical protein
MRVTQHTTDTLIIEEGLRTKIVGGLSFVVIGGLASFIGWIRGPIELVYPGLIFVLAGLVYLLFGKTHTHRFERWRGMLAIDSRTVWGSRRRELPLASIANVEFEEVRSPRSGPSYYIYYVTTQGERIPWAGTYDGSRRNTYRCYRTARQFLGMPDEPEPHGGETARR